MLKKDLITNELIDDKWSISPLLVLLGLLIFIVYSTWAAWQGEYFWWSDGHKGFGGYLSPFYSPPFFIDSSANGVPAISHALFGEWPVWLREIWPKWLPTSPAWLILIFPYLLGLHVIIIERPIIEHLLGPLLHVQLQDCLKKIIKEKLNGFCFKIYTE